MPRDLETICLHCLQKDPARRYASANEVADDLARFLRGEAIRARPISPVGKAWRWCRRRPAIAALIAALLAVVALAFWRIEHARRDEAAAKVRAETASGQLREAHARLAESLDTTELDRAEDLFRAGESADALALLARVVRRNPNHPVAGPRLASALWHGDFALLVPPPFSAGGYVLKMQLLRDAKTLLACRRNGIATFDAASGRRLLEFMHDGGEFSHFTLSPDERTLVAWDWRPGKKLHIFDTATGRQRVEPMNHEAWFHSVEFSPDGARFLIAGSDPVLRMHDAQTGEPVGEPLAHPAGTWCGVFSPDGTTVATCATDVVRLWSASTHVLLRELAPLGAEIHMLRYSPDGRWLLAVCHDGAMEFFSTADGQRTGLRMRHDANIRAVTFSANSQRLLTSSSDSTARLWSVPRGEAAAAPLRHRDAVNFVAFSPDGSRVVTCATDHTARVWDAVTGRALSQPLRHIEQPLAAAFTPDGATLYTSGADSGVARWSVRAIAAQPAPSTALNATKPANIRVSADGRLKLKVIGTTVEISDARTGVAIGTPLAHLHEIAAAEFSPDGTLVATGTRAKEGQIWDAATGRAVSPVLQHQRPLNAITWHPDGQRVATASWDSTARIWDARSGIQLARPLVHDDHVSDVHFSPDGLRIATASRDRTVRVWDAASSRPLTDALRHDAPVVQVRFEADGQRIVTRTVTGVRTWDVPAFSTPPPAWVAPLAEALSLAELKPDPAAVLALIARYEQTRAQAMAESGDGPYARLARRLFRRPGPRVTGH